ncbi:Serpentine Receptor, class H [Caenorhabditis elegans]|uniref:Serpentine Receptor, class H n=1 Tax=Caenorhabditis elegans TaxID=6239 RepID=O45738_CAEEL|nr:Serpentine Receptor, class H [Caenorhabditis elegans]CAB07279.2 Serpentine Receptor, class H [Caenorhabditis elegans]
MDTPNFLSTSLHIMSCVEVPVHIFGAYCILCKTPITMKSVKWSMLNLHFWSVFLDLTISILVIPYILFPAVVGRSLGLLEFVKVPQKLQLYLIVSLFPTVGVSITTLLENRYYLMFARFRRWKYFRTPFLTSLYLASAFCFLPSYLMIPEQEAALAEVLEGIPELREYIKDFDFLVLSSDSYGFFLTLIILITLVTATSLTFAWLLHANIRDRAGNNASKRTVQLQQIFFRAILIQTSMPICVLILPCSYLAFSMFTGYFNQAANNLSFIITAFHGIFSTVVMIMKVANIVGS